MKRGMRNTPRGKGIIPNERRRQLWRKHRLNLTDRRTKWFYQDTQKGKAQDEDGSEPALSEDD
ncbi:hypothetical protein [Aliidiomarina soli]|uniref:hypothetical protein n=1 Tax=Aliidiomarina soli TaxID=1928574 RepID=UPI000F8736F3|nr:hypothetical protein [Aliidiomarina soli]